MDLLGHASCSTSVASSHRSSRRAVTQEFQPNAVHHTVRKFSPCPEAVGQADHCGTVARGRCSHRGRRDVRVMAVAELERPVATKSTKVGQGGRTLCQLPELYVFAHGPGMPCEQSIAGAGVLTTFPMSFLGCRLTRCWSESACHSGWHSVKSSRWVAVHA